MAFQVPLVQKYCSCTDEFYNPTNLANKQRKFEEYRLSGLSTYDTLQKMKIVRLCCRESLFNPPTLFLNSENFRRVRDDTNKFKIEQSDTAEIKPIKNLPDLPV